MYLFIYLFIGCLLVCLFLRVSCHNKNKILKEKQNQRERETGIDLIVNNHNYYLIMIIILIFTLQRRLEVMQLDVFNLQYINTNINVCLLIKFSPLKHKTIEHQLY